MFLINSLAKPQVLTSPVQRLQAQGSTTHLQPPCRWLLQYDLGHVAIGPKHGREVVQARARRQLGYSGWEGAPGVSAVSKGQQLRSRGGARRCQQ